jgi:hypothetical protein
MQIWNWRTYKIAVTKSLKRVLTMKDVRTFSIIAAAAAVMAFSAGSALADSCTQTPNPSAHFGQAGSTQNKLNLVEDFFGPTTYDYSTVGSFMSDHVQDDVYSEFGPGRSGLAPNSENAQVNCVD